MKIEEANKILEEMNVYPEQLTGESKRLFEAIMKIVNDKDKYYAMVNLMAEYIGEEDTSEEFCYTRFKDCFECDNNCKLCVIKYFEERCK